MGNDEFSILLPNTGKDGAVKLARRINALIREFKFDALPDERITVSAGISTYQGEVSGRFDQMTQSAHQAMKKAKAEPLSQMPTHASKRAYGLSSR